MNDLSTFTALFLAGALTACQPVATPSPTPNEALHPAESSATAPVPAPVVEAPSEGVVQPAEVGTAPPATAAEASAPPAEPATPVAEASGAGSVTTPSTSVLFASDLPSLRANHVVANEDATCNHDNDCHSPLRCIDSVCAFPPAMTGFRTETSPRVAFTTSEGTFEYVVELAMTSPQQQRGLMHRRTMVADAGMIFVFPDERPRSFWMRNTLIPLDMVFVRADGVVDSFIVGAEPLTEVPRPSEGPARFVIELNAGETVTMGLRAGDRVAMQNVPL